nr:unnamed protein product [Digitaria exilis]
MPEQRTAKDRLQHLYLVFDDWHSGYSIRKVSLSRRSGKRVGSGEGAEPLPEVFMRIQADRGSSRYFTVDVSSYGVLPDGFVLLSTKRTTFILDTKEYVWKPYGNWVVPFTGRGHSDTSLEGFTLGYLYCSTMASIGTGDTLHPSPGFKCSKDKVFNKNPAERHVSANLLHMRPGKFCIVECVSIDNGRADQELREPGAAGGGGCYMYRVKTFSLGYDAKGDLKLKDSRVRCYSLPQEVTSDFLYDDEVSRCLNLQGSIERGGVFMPEPSRCMAGFETAALARRGIPPPTGDPPPPGSGSALAASAPPLSLPPPPLADEPPQASSMSGHGGKLPKPKNPNPHPQAQEP